MKQNTDLESLSMPKLLEREEGLCADIDSSKKECESLKQNYRELSNSVSYLCYEIAESSKKMRKLAMECDDIVVMDDVRHEMLDLTENLRKLADEYSDVVTNYTKSIETYASNREKICEKQIELDEVQLTIRKKALKEGNSSLKN